MKFMIKKLLLYLFLILIILTGILILIDARKILGIELSQVNDAEYEVNMRGERYIVKYVPKDNILPNFGRARNEFGVKLALVRDDLPKRVQRFVMYHEIYHLYDFDHGLHKSRIFKEIHANLASIPYEPLGFLQTTALTLTDVERIIYYVRLLF